MPKMLLTEFESWKNGVLYLTGQKKEGIPVSNYLKTKQRWVKGVFIFNIKELKSKDDKLKIYLWKPGNEELLVDDLTISFKRENE